MTPEFTAYDHSLEDLCFEMPVWQSSTRRPIQRQKLSKHALTAQVLTSYSLQFRMRWNLQHHSDMGAGGRGGDVVRPPSLLTPVMTPRTVINPFFPEGSCDTSLYPLVTSSAEYPAPGTKLWFEFMFISELPRHFGPISGVVSKRNPLASQPFRTRRSSDATTLGSGTTTLTATEKPRTETESGCRDSQEP